MDAAFAVFKKTAIVLSLALLAAMPLAAQAFTSPTGTTVVTLVNNSGSVSVTGSVDSTTPITFSVSVSYTAGDPHWLSVGSDSSVTGGCNGGAYTYTTPYTLLMGLGCVAGGLSSGSHTATVTLNATAPAGVSPVTFQVTYNTSGGGNAALATFPANLTGANQLTAPVGGQQQNFVTLSTASSSTVTFNISTPPSWLTVQASTNQVTNAAPATLTFTASAAGLSPGTYNTAVTVNGSGGQSVIINVAFIVTASGLTFTPGVLAWTYSSGALSPSTSTQNVSLVTPNSDSYTAVVSYPNGAPTVSWLHVNGAGSATGLGNGSTLTVGVVNYASLASGTYTGMITVTDSGNFNISGAFTVTLTVSGATSGGLTISPSPISLSSTNNYEQLVTVTSTIGGALSATAASTTGWLGVTASETSLAPGEQAFLTVSANTTLSGVGTFTGTITVQVGSVSQAVSVNLTAAGGSGTTTTYVAPTSLNFVAPSGGSHVIQQIVFAGDGTFSISGKTTYSTNSKSVAWLSIALDEGNLSALGQPVTIWADPSKLAPGTYTASVGMNVIADGEAVSPAPTLQVTFVVTSGEVISVASPSTGAVILNGSGTTQTATISVAATPALPVTVTTDQPSWLSATVASGATTPATISVKANAAGLSNGLYSGNVIVTGGASPLYVPVVLVLNGAANSGGLTVGSPSLTFAAQVGGGAPATQPLTVSSNPSGTAFSAKVTVTSPAGGAWLSISPTTNLTTNQTLTVSAIPAGLAQGTYAGNIALTATASGITVSVPVNLVVGTTTPGGITVSASSLSFTASSGGAAPKPQELTVSSAAGSAGVSFTAAASSTGNWLSVSPAAGTTQDILTVSVNQANLALGNQTGHITITPASGSAVVVPVTVNVIGQSTIAVDPEVLAFSFQAGSGGTVSPGQLTVYASGGTATFQATASSVGSWLSVTPASGTTSTSTSTILTVQVTPAGLTANATPYTGTITIAGVSGTQGSIVVDVSLTVTNPLPSITAVENAASGLIGPVSPGEIVSIYGSQIGPTLPATLTLDSTGKVSTSIGGVEVSFSGYLAPLTYVSAIQINAIVPYELAGNKEPFVEVKFAGATSNEPSLQLAPSAPGIFTVGNGTGPGAILNFDASVNTQQNPAAKGSTIVLFMTGEGLTTPAQATGAVTPVNFTGVGPLTPAPQLAVSVMIGNQPAYVAFNGEAPYFVAGVLQVNAVVPATVGDGAIRVTVQIGNQISQSGVTVWVQ